MSWVGPLPGSSNLITFSIQKSLSTYILPNNTQWGLATITLKTCVLLTLTNILRSPNNLRCLMSLSWRNLEFEQKCFPHLHFQVENWVKYFNFCDTDTASLLYHSQIYCDIITLPMGTIPINILIVDWSPWLWNNLKEHYTRIPTKMAFKKTDKGRLTKEIQHLELIFKKLIYHLINTSYHLIITQTLLWHIMMICYCVYEMWERTEERQCRVRIPYHKTSFSVLGTWHCRHSGRIKRLNHSR